MSVCGIAAWVCHEMLRPVAATREFYLQQGGFSTSIPTWASISTRFQPGVPDPYKIDSIYTGDWTSLGVTSIAVDLNVIQVATWATDRAVTLELLQMDETGFNVNYDATYTLPDLPNPPVGWQTYSFPINANSPTIPEGWIFTRGDGTPGTDAEWSPFLHRIDLTSIGFYKPGFAYPSLGTWILGIDNVEIDFQTGPTPTPTPSATPTPSPTATPPPKSTPEAAANSTSSPHAATASYHLGRIRSRPLNTGGRYCAQSVPRQRLLLRRSNFKAASKSARSPESVIRPLFSDDR